MRPRRWILLCAAVAALPDSAIGQTEPASATGSALVVSCQANEPRCGAYLQGVLDMMTVAGKAECRATRYDASARSGVVYRWADQHSVVMGVHLIIEKATCMERMVREVNIGVVA